MLGSLRNLTCLIHLSLFNSHLTKYSSLLPPWNVFPLLQGSALSWIFYFSDHFPAPLVLLTLLPVPTPLFCCSGICPWPAPFHVLIHNLSSTKPKASAAVQRLLTQIYLYYVRDIFYVKLSGAVATSCVELRSPWKLASPNWDVLFV